jgi:hypothetical protein
VEVGEEHPERYWLMLGAGLANDGSELGCF